MSLPIAILAEPRRQEILRLVWDGERSAGDIAGRLPITFGAVSQHLRVLHEAGLVRLRKEGRQRWYIADREALGPLAGALEELWGHRLGELKRLAEAEQARIDSRTKKRAPVRSRRHRREKP
jgi:DNA-binding transcriptional ArsR family regulator